MVLERLHEATHQLPGVPEHTDHATGHQGRRNPRGGFAQPGAHRQVRPPKMLIGWQRRIAALFGQWI